MDLRKQLLLTCVGLVLTVAAAMGAVVTWYDTHVQLEERAALIAVSAARLRDPGAVEHLAWAEGLTVRIVDTAVNTLTVSPADSELSDTDRTRLRTAVDSRSAQSYQEDGAPRGVAPIIDSAGQVVGAVLVTFPPGGVQTAIVRRVQATAATALAVLIGGTALACISILVLMKPVVRLDAAVAALGSYRFKPESLDDLAQHTNELGRMAGLLQRMANAEQGWRRSLEGLREARDELEQRVEQRTRDLSLALQEQTALNNQLQVVGAGLQRSIGELRVLAEVSRAIGSTPDARQLLTTILMHAVRLSRSDGGTIYEFDEARGVFIVRASDGVDPEIIEHMQTDGELSEASIIGQAALQRQPTQVPDMWAAGPAGQELGFRSLLAVPLLREGSLVGGIVVRRREPGAFEPDTVSLLQTIAVQSILAVGPHGVSYENRVSIQTQQTSGEPPLDTSRLRSALRGALPGAMESARFRKDRLAIIRASEGPIELPPTAKVVLHLSPVHDCSEAKHHDLIPAVRYLAPLGRGFTSQDVNFDGVLTCERKGDQVTAYAQGFWNGRIEMVDTLLLAARGDGRTIPTLALEDSLVRTLDFVRRYYEQLAIEPPYSLGLAFLGVRGYRLAVDEMLWSEMSNHPVERAELVFPEITIEDRSTPSHLVWRPLFDLLWNACGFERCLDYDPDGKWSPRSSSATNVLARG
jgi:hypothetical protein